MSSNQGFLLKAQFFLVIFGGLYIAAVGLLAVPFVQSHILYLNAVRLPWFADFNTPEKYGLAPNKTFNFHIKTSDNETLGAWFILSDPYYRTLPSIPSTLEAHIPVALKEHPTILFFHGNAATRAFSARISHYQAFSSRLGVNVLAIDYRGFADSTGQPSEAGLVRDARAAWDWLITQGSKAEDIIVIGHSLGTGVASQFGAELARHDINCRGLVLLSPFSSIREVLNTYNILGVIPLMKPLAIIPGASKLVTRALIHKFDSLSVVKGIKAPVLIAHAENDWDIPYMHSEVLFEAFLEQYLPTLPIIGDPLTTTAEQWTEFKKRQDMRQSKRKELVTHSNLPKFGTMSEFTQDGRKIVLLKTLAGGHDYLGVQEGVQDIIGRVFNLF